MATLPPATAEWSVMSVALVVVTVGRPLSVTIEVAGP